jgi:hypothetical protein
MSQRPSFALRRCPAKAIWRAEANLQVLDYFAEPVIERGFA